jgi:hypothetical protein
MGPNDWTTERLLVGTAGRTPVWPPGMAQPATVTGRGARPGAGRALARGHRRPTRPVCGSSPAPGGTRGAPALPGLGRSTLRVGRERRRHRRVQRSRRRSVARSARGAHRPPPGRARPCRAPGGSRPRDQPRLGAPEGGSAVSVDENQSAHDRGPRRPAGLAAPERRLRPARAGASTERSAPKTAGYR